MAKSKNEKIENLFYMSGKMDEKQKQRDNKNKIKEREKRIKQNKLKQKDAFDLDNEIVIGMTNKNNQKKRIENNKKISKKQQEILRKQKKVKNILKLTALMFLLISIMIFAFVSPIFNIKEIQVINNKEESQLASDTILSLSRLSSGQNIFRFNKLQVEYNINKNPYVKQVLIKRKFPNKVIIEVEEREKSYNIEFMNGYAYIDNQGYILEVSDTKLEKPIIQGIMTQQENIIEGNRLITEDLEKLEIVIKIVDICKTYNLDSKITSIDISDRNNYIIYLENEKKTVYLGDNSNLNNKIVWVEAIIQDNIGIEGYVYVNGDFNNGFKPRFKEKV